jgi:peptidoglycan/LPS O-acetylase OafA/YrhL
VCAGFLASAHLQRPAGDPFNPAPAAPPQLHTAGPAAVLAFLLFLVPAFLLPAPEAFFFQILAWLLLAVPLVQWIAARWQPRWLLFAGRESLVLYAAHLLLIETLAIAVLPRGGFGVAGCAVVFAIVLVVTGVVGIGWVRRREARSRVA